MRKKLRTITYLPADSKITSDEKIHIFVLHLTEFFFQHLSYRLHLNQQKMPNITLPKVKLSTEVLNEEIFRYD